VGRQRRILKPKTRNPEFFRKKSREIGRNPKYPALENKVELILMPKKTRVDITEQILNLVFINSS